MALPKIGIVIPVYRAERFLQATLESLLAQSEPRWHCVIVDDGSPDHSAVIAENYCTQDSRFKLIRQENAGVAAARNKGMAAIPLDIPFCIFMDSDDIWEPGALKLLSDTLEQHPEAVGAHGLACGIGEDGARHASGFEEFGRTRYGYRAGKTVPLTLSDPTTYDCFAMKFTQYPPCLILLRRNVLEKNGEWADGLAPAEDWDYFARASRFGPIVFVDQVIAGYRKHGNNASDSVGGHWWRKQRILRRMVSLPDNSPTHNQLAYEAYKAWNRYTRSSKLQTSLAQIRTHSWRAALQEMVSFTALSAAQLISVIDLSLHRRQFLARSAS